MTRNATGKRELLEQPPHPARVLGDVGINFRISAFEIGIRHQSWSAVARPGDIDGVEVVFFNNAIQVDVEEVQSRRRAPMAEQARFDVRQLERLLQQRIIVEIDLADREIVRCPPVSVHVMQ